ncbi:LysE family translocator [Cohaesibacter haloalkalitolerans]|uniref:LysE family translocator n=1 Tax=Cohaesibacter haloalkalitolerans TaxID=1162980 RepID=UPI000E657A2F|nr:LysE family transporter [Cohaesibacter haloalkalitolerans]
MTYDQLITYLPALLPILAVFSVGVASPGPATLMILGTAMSQGRSTAIALSFGIVTGSLFWGGVAAFGLVAAMKASAGFFMVLKLAGGVYLIYLAVRSWRSALITQAPAKIAASSRKCARRSYFRGLLLHLTNPKAPLVWIATLSIGLGDTAPIPFLILAIVLCETMALIIFVGYAFVFSTPTASNIYSSARRPFEALIGVLFGAAAIKILTAS